MVVVKNKEADPESVHGAYLLFQPLRSTCSELDLLDTPASRLHDLYVPLKRFFLRQSTLLSNPYSTNLPMASGSKPTVRELMAATEERRQRWDVPSHTTAEFRWAPDPDALSYPGLDRAAPPREQLEQMQQLITRHLQVCLSSECRVSV
jgi:hypothetical protein